MFSTDKQDMDFSIMPSLKHIALCKIAITLVNHDDIRQLLAGIPSIYNSIRSGANRKLFTEAKKKKLELYIEDKLSNYIRKLQLPDLLKKELLGFVHSVSWQLLKFREYYVFYDSFEKDIAKLYWTPHGTIDRKKSVEMYVKDESIDVDERFALACEHCLEYYIHTLWKQYKGLDNCNPNRNLRKIISSDPPLVIFWSLYISKKLHLLSGVIKKFRKRFRIIRNITPYVYMFKESVQSCNETAARFYFEKLTHEEKEKEFVDSVIYSAGFHGMDSIESDGESFADIACFLVSKMNSEQLKKIPLSCSMLQCCLTWPRQILFMKIAKSMFCCPPLSHFTLNLEGQYYNGEYYKKQHFNEEDYKEQYYKVLEMIIYKIKNDFKDFNYKTLLQKFWYESHITYRNYVLENYATDYVLSTLFGDEYKENIPLGLKEATISRKRKTFCNEE